MTEIVRAGYQSKLYYKNGANWVEIKVAQDVEIDDSPEMIDASARLDGVKRVWPGMIEGKISFKILAIEGETAYEFLKNAAHTKVPVEMAMTEGADIATTGTTYERDWFALTWKRGEPLNGMPTIDIEASPTIVFVAGALVARSFVTV